MNRGDVAGIKVKKHQGIEGKVFMSWGCPHIEGERCGKLKKNCYPTQRGCELHGKVRMQDPGLVRRSWPDGWSGGVKHLKIATKKKLGLKGAGTNQGRKSK